MKIYQMQGDTVSYREELYQLMLAHPGTTDYFTQCKQLFTKEEWKAQWNAILAQYQDHLSSIVDWLHAAGRYDLIMDSAEPNRRDIIELFEEELFARYPQRCLKVLEKDADDCAKLAKNRSDYAYLVKLLKKIAKHPGGKEFASELAAKYREQYPRKRAMMEELHGI